MNNMEYLRIPKRREDFKKLVRRLLVKERKLQRESLFSPVKLFDNLPIDRVVAMFRPQDRDRAFKMAHIIDCNISSALMVKAFKKSNLK